MSELYAVSSQVGQSTCPNRRMLRFPPFAVLLWSLAMARPLLALLLLLMPVLASAQTFRFGLRRDIATSLDPAGVAVGDFDRDGRLDFAVTERGIDSMTV